MPRKIRPIRIEGKLAYVSLTRGYEAIIDADDVALVGSNNWHSVVTRKRNGEVRAVYAGATIITPQGKQLSLAMHRALMGSPHGLEIDHIDGNGLNNTRSNLRIANKSQNACNRRPRIDNLSGIKGVRWREKIAKWEARISVDGKDFYLGCYKCRTSAMLAYAKASADIHSGFGRVA